MAEQAPGDRTKAIERLAQAFAPFDTDELKVLKRYVEECDRMRGSRLAKLPSLEVDITLCPEFATNLSLTEEDFGGLLMPFRQLYLKKHRTEFGKVRNLLSRHLKGEDTDDSRHIMGYLKHLKSGYQNALRESPMGTIFEADPNTMESSTYTPKDIIEQWLNGVFFHQDEDAAQQVEGADRALSAFFMADAVITVSRYMVRLGEVARMAIEPTANRR